MSDKNFKPACHIMPMAGANTIIKDTMVQEPEYDNLPVLPTRNLVLFPGITMPLTLVREQAFKVAHYAMENKLLVGLSCQNDPLDDNITDASQLVEYGSIVKVIDIIDLPDKTKAAVVMSFEKYRLLGNSEKGPADGMLRIRVKPVSQPKAKLEGTYLSLINEIKNFVASYQEHGGDIDPTIPGMVSHLEEDDVVNYVSTSFPLSVPQKVELLSIFRLPKRADRLLVMLQQKREELELTNKFRQRAREAMDQGHREAFMREEMDAIRRELYGDADPTAELSRLASEKPLPVDVRQVVERDLTQMSRTNPSSPDYSMLSGYLETLIGMPWGTYTTDTDDVLAAEKVLENDHYGLTKVKERVLEQIAAMMSNSKGHAPILCLVGPPGVGKTSLGQSVARALGRKYQRVSFGGLHDEAEIRGHRRTYIGAMPGRVIAAMKRAGTMNPVLMLDEIDKIGADYKGDPSAALLEVLDPEQNCHFHDNFLDVDFDLSKVMFIATANTLQTVSQPLLDRMEIIELQGYATEEKVEIARRHLVPRILKEYDLEKTIKIPDETLVKIIDSYTLESGVRGLDKQISKIVRRWMLLNMKGDKRDPEILPEKVADYLGNPVRLGEHYEGNDIPGVVTGLAWTAAGGEILFIEAATVPGKEAKLSLTGNLGDVMKESATLAMQYVRGHASELGIPADKLENSAIHIHVPAGAIPKDGPSAGVTMVTAIVSALTGKKVREGLAMTGEITLRGRITPIGGVKEKILAAKRSGLSVIALPEENRKDVEEIEPEFIKGLDIHYFRHLSDLLKFALPE